MSLREWINWTYSLSQHYSYFKISHAIEHQTLLTMAVMAHGPHTHRNRIENFKSMHRANSQCVADFYFQLVEASRSRRHICIEQTVLGWCTIECTCEYVDAWPKPENNRIILFGRMHEARAHKHIGLFDYAVPNFAPSIYHSLRNLFISILWLLFAPFPLCANCFSGIFSAHLNIDENKNSYFVILSTKCGRWLINW